ncbi:MAG: AAA family ATPase [Bacteroidales bacterium]|nr:AAA family ATPase [Bacteroidales bacterium]
MDINTIDATEREAVFAFASIRDLVNQALKITPPAIQPVSHGLTTGFHQLDLAISGFQKGKLSTIAVRPGMGKTALLLSFVNNLAIKNNYTVAVFSAERSSEKMTSRLIETETGMSVDKLKKGSLKDSERDHMISMVNNIAKAKIFLDDTPSLSIDEFIKKSRQLKILHNVDVIFIDYLELLTTSIMDTTPRPEQLNSIVAGIKDIAVELNLPVVLFSQMPIPMDSPANNTRPGIKDLPVYLSELSDILLILHRPVSAPESLTEQQAKSMVELIIARNNQGNHASVVPLRFVESIAKFVDF